MANRAVRWSWPLAALLGLTACDSAPPGEEEARPTTEVEARAYRGLPAGSHEGEVTSLLAQYSQRDPIDAREASQWQLPFQGKRIAVALLTTAALDRLEDLPLLLTPDARWGLPHRSEYGAREVFADGGAAFLDALRGAASRFKGVDPSADAAAPGGGGSAVYTCPPLVPGAQQVVQTGAEPYWCFYQSADRLDLIVLKLRVVQGAARIEYVGLFEDRPDRPVPMPASDKPPPLTPPVKMPNVQKVGGGAPMLRGGPPPSQTSSGAPANVVPRRPQGRPAPTAPPPSDR